MTLKSNMPVFSSTGFYPNPKLGSDPKIVAKVSDHALFGAVAGRARRQKQGGASRPSQEDENLASDLVYFGNAVAAMRAALRRYHA
jgi:hypothetical protein